MKKAIVFDNSGTLIERYRVIKDVFTGRLFSDINSLDLIDASDSLALVVLQYNTNKFLDLNPDSLISDVIRDFDIDFDVSFSNRNVAKDEVSQILLNEKSSTVSDITDAFDSLYRKIPEMELCNGSALIIDMDLEQIIYTISSAGKLFSNVLKTVDILKSREIEIFIASGDRIGAIKRLARLLDINPDNAFGSVSTRGKGEIVSDLKNRGFKVMMVGDGLNDVLAFKNADISVLTVEQQEEVSPKLMNTTDFIIKDIFEVTDIDF